MIEFDRIITQVGNERRTVDADTFFDTFDELVELFACQGLSGNALDVAVRDALPIRLAELVGDRGKPH
jgi:hypothetical protein